ncbi:hypothetical protein BO71DRAFT_153383 [Aspergillus ellipticus CBS 707.79]|uniref:Uncharacterized protein n=1 Tax=Aspergillus ellipticus CBS 707.79 TaxID=1448320 RepID=A0A319DIM3_9EURO|nr:hypothetical protein BO71DRAFT_153383 [Aspergillus ellipticus CBS 707.79]
MRVHMVFGAVIWILSMYVLRTSYYVGTPYSRKFRDGSGHSETNVSQEPYPTETQTWCRRVRSRSRTMAREVGMSVNTDDVFRNQVGSLYSRHPLTVVGSDTCRLQSVR